MKNAALSRTGFGSAAEVRAAAERLGLFRTRPARVPKRPEQAAYQRAYRERLRLREVARSKEQGAGQ